MRRLLLEITGFMLLGLVVTVTLYAVKLTSRDRDFLGDKLKNYEARDARIVNMEKTIRIVYDLSEPEAHYYSIIFDDFSLKYGVPWEAYAALVRIESNFNPTVISPKKARGITQVLEGTGKEVAAKLGIPFNEATLWNDFLNMVIGFTYFSEGFVEKKDSTQEVALKHAIRRYLGGPDYLKFQEDNAVYVKEYKNTVWQEYIRLSYIYKGVLYDLVHVGIKPPESLFEKIWRKVKGPPLPETRFTSFGSMVAHVKDSLKSIPVKQDTGH